MNLPVDSRARFAVGFVALLVAFGVVLAVISRLEPTPSGPRSSSYATSPQGLAALAEVLRRNGHPVRRLRTPISEERPRDGETLFVLDPDVMEPEEARAIAAWVHDGGRLVTGGGDPGWLGELLERPPAWRPGGTNERRTLVRTVESANAEVVIGAEGGRWRQLGSALPVIGPANGPLLVTAEAGAGTVALLADTSPLQNRRLAHGDAAALGIGLAGGAETPVAFLETVHGYGVSRGFGGLPANVRWTILGLGLTALVAVWAAGRRFGPPEDPDEELPPPRVEYVDALAAALARSKPDKEKRS